MSSSSTSHFRPPPPAGAATAVAADAASAAAAYKDALRVCEEVQLMIEINILHLDKLRASPGEKTSELTKQEIRNLERKFIHLFSQLIAARAGAVQASGGSFGAGAAGSGVGAAAALQNYPSLSQWLHVVGISPESQKALEARVSSVDQLREKADSELHRILLASPSPPPAAQRAEDLRRLSRAMQGLRRYSEILHVHGGGPATRQEAAKLELYWDSWSKPGCPPGSSSSIVSNTPSSTSSLECSASSSSSSPKPDTAGLSYVYGPPATSSLPQNSGGSVSVSGSGSAGSNAAKTCDLPPKPDSVASSLSSNSSLASSLPPASPGVALSPPVISWPEKKSTPPSTPPWSAAAIFGAKQQQQKFPTTPPPAKKHSTTAAASNKAAAAAAAAAAATPASTSLSSSSSDYPLTKSKSHECELGNRINPTSVSASQSSQQQQQQQQQQPPVEPPKRTPTAAAGGGVGVSVTAAVGRVVQERAGMGGTGAGPGPGGDVSSSSGFVSGVPVAGSGAPFASSSSSRWRPRQTAFSESSAQADDVHAPSSGSTTAADSTPSPLPSPSPFETSLDSSGNSYSSVSQSLHVPKSPRTPRSMGHAIRHRFKKTLKPGRCDHCSEYMFNGLKCRECKFKCHRDCESKVPPSCSLPDDLVDYYVKQMTKEGSPILPHMRPQGPGLPHYASGPASDFRLAGSLGSAFSSGPLGRQGGGGGGGAGSAGSAYPDSSSNTSSCNSSTPSSPAVVVTASHPTPPHSASIHNKGTRFTFPDPPVTLRLHDPPAGPSSAGPLHHHHHNNQQNQPPLSAGGGFGGGGIGATLFPHQAQPAPKVTSPNPIIDSVKSYDSDKTLSATSGSSGSGGTAYRLDSQDSTASVDDSSSTWTAGRQTSISLREWDIQYEELDIGDKIGSGRFSTVHQGKWHGDVAIKILNMENTDDAEATLEAFRLDVSTFKKTRHENLLLFMGACMNPPKLAIVTSLCKGNTLYTLLHLRKDKFPINKLVIIAQQIAQGMGYLHHRGIVHKDLKTKNIFLENGHAIIADFGLVNVARRLCAHHGPGPAQSRESMSIPKGWLCYLAPEIMRALRVNPDGTSGDGNGGGNMSGGAEDDLPFTKASDVFAFGTVWFELLTGEWPWRGAPPETVIWLVGKGMQPSLANLQASRDVKNVLQACWTFPAERRPDFTALSDLLEKIPKKRVLIRSPSHPVHLWRSAESVF